MLVQFPGTMVMGSGLQSHPWIVCEGSELFPDFQQLFSHWRVHSLQHEILQSHEDNFLYVFSMNATTATATNTCKLTILCFFFTSVLYIYIQTCMCVYMYVYIHTHTYSCPRTEIYFQYLFLFISARVNTPMCRSS